MLNKIIRSSADSSRISLTLKAAVPTIIFGLGLLGIIEISQNDLYEVIEAIVTFMSAGVFLFGFFRKVYILLNK